MQHLSVMLLAVLSLVCVMSSTVLAAEESLTPIGHPLVEQIFSYLGMLVAALTTLATVLPRHWRVTQLFARFSVDLRGILTPDPSDDPEWAKRIRRDTNVMLVLAALCALPGCAFWRESVAPVVAECAPDRQYVIQGLAEILEGANAYEVLDRIKDDKGPELVLCALERFLDRVAVSPETATQRVRARAYLDSRR